MAKKTAIKEICTRKNGKVECVKPGDFLYESWGYDQTQNNFCKVKDISPSGKTLKCQMVQGKVVSRKEFYMDVGPTNKPIDCPPVRLHTRKWDGRMYFTGSYPYLSNIRRPEDCRSKRKGSFSKYTKPVYQTDPRYGH